MFKGGALNADAVTFGAEKIDKNLQEEFGKVRGKKVLPFNAESVHGWTWKPARR